MSTNCAGLTAEPRIDTYRRAAATAQGVLRGEPVPQACKDMTMDRVFSRIASRMATWTGQPLTFILALATILVWAVTGPLFQWSNTWQLVINTGTTIITFLMVFLIQNAQNRDASAMQVKLDELIRAVAHARNDYIGIEHLTDAQIGAIRDTLEADKDLTPAGRRARARELNRMIDRR